MLMLIARYYLLLLFINSNNVNADHIFMRQMEADDKLLYTIISCTARCLQHQQQVQKQQQQFQQHKFLSSCFQLCHNRSKNAAEDTFENMKKIQENYVLKLICRDDASLTFRIDLEGNLMYEQKTQPSTVTATAKGTLSPPPLQNSPTTTKSSKLSTTSPNHFKDIIYFVKIHESKDAEQSLVYLSDDNFFTINNLKHNTTHNLTVMAVHASNEYSVITKEEQYATLRRGYIPAMINDIIITFSLDEVNEHRLNAKIVWKPSADMTCNYNIICFSPENADYDLTPLEIRNPRQLYTYNLENLTFSVEYKVGIRAKNPNNVAKESELFWKVFRTPSCVEWFDYDFNMCPPLKPESLEVEQKFIGGDSFSFNITWQQPHYFPDYYTLRILDLAENGNVYEKNISKEINSIFIDEMKISGGMYEAYLTAYTPGGKTTAYKSDFSKLFVVVSENKNHFIKLFSAIFAPIFCIVLLSLTMFIICHRRAKLKRNQERCKYFEDLEKKAPIDPKATFDIPSKSLSLLTSPEESAQLQLDLEDKLIFNDAMEIDRNDITIHEILGEGAFGLVRRGIYKDIKQKDVEVAVKMLKDQPTVDDVRAFLREIEVMKSVEHHPNIVGIIGHCTKRYNEMMLLTEYCSLGNLLDFLRNEWKYLHELNSMSQNVADTCATTYHILQQNNDKSQQHHKHQYHNGGSSQFFNIDNKLIEKFKFKYKNIINTNHQQPQQQPQQQQQQSVNKTSTALNRTTSHVEVISSVNESKTSKNSPTKASMSAPSLEIMAAAAATSAPATAPTPAIAADNKCYGYDEICTNSCKCQVDVIRDISPNDGNREEAQQLDCLLQQKLSAMPTTMKSIQVKDCDCKQLLLLAKNNKKNTAIGVAVAVAVAAPTHKQLSIENEIYFKCVPEDAPPPPPQSRSTQPPKQEDKQNLSESKRDFHEEEHPNDDDVLSTSAKREPLLAGDLLDIAKQVAVGMEFLAKNKVVHRDLAARNVLVSTDRTIKIADFGLSRDIYQENIYKKTGTGKLPIKWLALESMTHQVYSTQSDVWSYGILLYEIVTLGSTPYPSIPTNRLLYLLKTGYRMEKPRNCGQELYKLMYSCWNAKPNERPNFTEIIKIIDNLMLWGSSSTDADNLNISLQQHQLQEQQEEEEEQQQQRQEQQQIVTEILQQKEKETDEEQTNNALITDAQEVDSDESYLKPL